MNVRSFVGLRDGIGAGGGQLGLFGRRRGRGTAPGQQRRATDEDDAHLRQWAATRRGVEAFVEPRTTVTATTVVLVAHDGEWTRRRVDGPDGARRLGKRLRIPVYDVALVGYPQRMRDYTNRQRALRERDRRRDLEA
jgi:hypothetical protein